MKITVTWTLTTERAKPPQSLEPTPEAPRPPMVDTKHAADLSRAAQWDFDRRPPVRLGFALPQGDE